MVKLDLIVATCYVQSVTEIQIAFFLLFKEQLEELKASKTRRKLILCKDSTACVINLL